MWNVTWLVIEGDTELIIGYIINWNLIVALYLLIVLFIKMLYYYVIYIHVTLVSGVARSYYFLYFIINIIVRSFVYVTLCILIMVFIHLITYNGMLNKLNLRAGEIVNLFLVNFRIKRTLLKWWWEEHLDSALQTL